MVQMVEDIVNVIGDSLDACLYSRYLASKPNISRIDHYTTGEYGGFYFDQIKDSAYCVLFLTDPQLSKITDFLPNLQTIQVEEHYLKAQIKKMKFSSPYDEYVTFPINRSSFELDMDYADNILKTYTYDEFIAEYREHKNITKLMKCIFSENFYMNLIKKIGCNQWNTNQSQLDAGRLYGMLQLGQLSSETPFKYHYPVNGISSLCRELLNHPKIKIHTANRKTIKAETKAQTNKITYLFEYIDYYMDFMFGGFEYVVGHTDVHSKSISEYKYFRVLTPFDKKYYSYFGVDATSYKAWNETSLITSHDFKRQLLIPTQANYRRMNDYRKISQVNRNFKVLV
jgi:hypothetical protein